MTQSSIHMGEGIGGTFTNVVLEVDTRQFPTKVLTTYSVAENLIPFAYQNTLWNQDKF